MPKHLLKGYLEHKGMSVCVECKKKVTRDFVGESRFVSYFSVAVEYLAFTKKRHHQLLDGEKSTKLTFLISIPRWCRMDF